MSQFVRNLLVITLLFLPGCSIDSVVPSDEDWSFVVFGDSRQGYGIYGELVQSMSQIEPNPKFAICLGDIMLEGSNEAEWERFWDVSEPITDIMPLHIARGNHEGNDEISELIYKEQTGILADTFHYSFEYDQSTFIILDSYIRDEEQMIGPGQFRWLQSELDAAFSNSQAEHIFIFLHHPLYPQGKYLGKNLKNADELHSLFLQHRKIKAVIMAHEHSFNKYMKDSITYITTAGAGAPLYRGFGGDYYHYVKVSFYAGINNFHVKTVGIFNEVIDQFDL